MTSGHKMEKGKRGRIGKRVLALLLSLAAAGSAFAQETEPVFRIAAASDLHLDPGTQQKGAVNPLVPYNEEITEALLWDVLQEKPDVLLLLGDLTNSGRLSQHQVLLEKLRKAEEEGLTILVLPGNHDIGEVKPEAFLELYGPFGYQEAVSRDPASLSYAYQVGPLLFLMLDTNGYSGSVTTAFLSEETLDWMEEQIRLAQEKGLEILPAEHYSFLTGQTTAFIGADRMKEILKANEIPLTLSGHLHQRCVAYEEGLYELVVEAATAYPCCYALLEYDKGYRIRYEPESIDVEGWARQQTGVDPVFEDFKARTKELFHEKCQETVETLGRGRKLTGREKEKALSFFISFQEAYAQGRLYRMAGELKEHEGYESFTTLASGTVYGLWVPLALETAVPQTEGFALWEEPGGGPGGDGW